MAKKEKTVEIQPITVKEVILTIEGDSDLVLNKMDDYTKRQLIRKQKNLPKETEAPDEWEILITKLHWRDGTPKEFSEESMKDALINNAPCISTFSLKKTFADAMKWNGIENIKTGFNATVSVVAPNGLVPIRFTDHYIDEKIIKTALGSPVLAILHRFGGWSADITIRFVDNGQYSLDRIIQIINLAGFSVGIGSGKTTGYGRYHIAKATVM